MSKSKFFIIFFIIILLLGGAAIFYFYFYNKTPVADPNAGNRQNFFGFDQNQGDIKGPTNNSTDSETSTNDQNNFSATGTVAEVPRLRLISSVPIAGADFTMKNVVVGTTSTTYRGVVTTRNILASVEFIRYILKGNGNIYETATGTPSTIRLSNTTIPKLQEAFFDTSGDKIIIRNIIGDDGIQTRLVQLRPIVSNSTSSPNTTEMSAVLSELPGNITDLSVSSDRSKIFYTRNTNPRGTVSQFDGGAQVAAFNSPFIEWLSQWGGTSDSKTVFLNTKPSITAEGFLYALDTTTGSIKKVLGNIVGLTSLVSKDGNNLIYGGTGNGDLQISLHNLKDSSERFLFPETLPEKCVWANKSTEVLYCAVPKNLTPGNYPDAWYMGLIHFNDDLYMLDLKNSLVKLVLSPDQIVGVPFDMTNLKIGKNDDYLIFTDKNTMALWGVRLN